MTRPVVRLLRFRSDSDEPLVWQFLLDEYQFPGAGSTVRRYVREHRPVSDGEARLQGIG